MEEEEQRVCSLTKKRGGELCEEYRGMLLNQELNGEGEHEAVAQCFFP